MSHEQVVLGEEEKRVLMELQYNWPRGPRPYHEAAQRLGMDVEDLIGILGRLRRSGALKRIGFYVNYRSRGLRAALIAYRAGEKIGDLADLYRRDPLATHVYQRDHPVYDLWVVTKRRSLEELVRHAEQVSREYGVDYVVLYSRKTLKLSVKFDLYRGVSRAGRYSRVHESPPRPEDLGVPGNALNLLRSLPLDGEPYRPFAEALGVDTLEAAETAWRLLEAGILGDPGAALDGHRIGFTENAMVVMEPGPGREESLCECARGLPYSTHVVLRGSIPEGKWRHTCYFMVHATSRDKLESLVDDARARCRPRSLHAIRSIADLKPGVVR